MSFRCSPLSCYQQAWCFLKASDLPLKSIILIGFSGLMGLYAGNFLMKRSLLALERLRPGKSLFFILRDLEFVWIYCRRFSICKSLLVVAFEFVLDNSSVLMFLSISVGYMSGNLNCWGISVLNIYLWPVDIGSKKSLIKGFSVTVYISSLNYFLCGLTLEMRIFI